MGTGKDETWVDSEGWGEYEEQVGRPLQEEQGLINDSEVIPGNGIWRL